MSKLILTVCVGLILANLQLNSSLAHIQKDVSTLEATKSELEEQIMALEASLAAAPEERDAKWEGIASYYSEEGCIGCDPNLIMANGKRFTNEGMTVAFNRLPLGSMVEIRNGGNRVVAEVTDTGGFEPLGRIVDLSPAVKEALVCDDLCEVEIREVK